MDEFKSQDLANTAWAFATAGQWHENMFVALARAAEQRVSEFKTEEPYKVLIRSLKRSLLGL